MTAFKGIFLTEGTPEGARGAATAGAAPRSRSKPHQPNPDQAS
jgi:hypothetical protein